MLIRRAFIYLIETQTLCSRRLCFSPLPHLSRVVAHLEVRPIALRRFPAGSMMKEGPVQETEDPEKSHGQTNNQNEHHSNHQSNRHLRNAFAGCERSPRPRKTSRRRGETDADAARASRIHAGRHAPRGGEGRQARSELRHGHAYNHAPRWTDEFAGAHLAHENAAAAGPDLDGAPRWLAAGVSPETRGRGRERRAGNGAASCGVLERESRGFSVSQQGRAHFRRGQRIDGLGRNPRLWISRAKGRTDPHRDDDVQPNHHVVRQGVSGSRDSVSGGERYCCCRSEEHTSELQSLTNLVCRLL